MSMMTIIYYKYNDNDYYYQIFMCFLTMIIKYDNYYYNGKCTCYKSFAE